MSPLKEALDCEQISIQQLLHLAHFLLLYPPQVVAADNAHQHTIRVISGGYGVQMVLGAWEVVLFIKKVLGIL